MTATYRQPPLLRTRTDARRPSGQPAAFSVKPVTMLLSLADAGVVTGVGAALQGRERGARGHAICSGTAPEFVEDQHSRPVLSLIVVAVA
jgi:hypothetical protein